MLSMLNVLSNQLTNMKGHKTWRRKCGTVYQIIWWLSSSQQSTQPVQTTIEVKALDLTAPQPSLKDNLQLSLIVVGTYQASQLTIANASYSFQFCQCDLYFALSLEMALLESQLQNKKKKALIRKLILISFPFLYEEKNSRVRIIWEFME